MIMINCLQVSPPQFVFFKRLLRFLDWGGKWKKREGASFFSMGSHNDLCESPSYQVGQLKVRFNLSEVK